MLYYWGRFNSVIFAYINLQRLALSSLSWNRLFLCSESLILSPWRGVGAGEGWTESGSTIELLTFKVNMHHVTQYRNDSKCNIAPTMNVIADVLL